MAFWNRTKKRNLGQHRSAFASKKTLTLLETSHTVVGCELSKPVTLFWVGKFLSMPRSWRTPFRRFRTQLKSRALSITVRLLRVRKTLTLLETRPLSRCMLTFKTSNTVLGWVVSFGATTLMAPFSTFWDENKKWTLGQHRSAFPGK